jgi:spermidine/putrescine ABC transporter ATP-binding subunit
MSAVTLNALTKAYDKTPVISDISLSIASGEFLTLLGASGCGKTTLLRIIAGLVEPDAGRIVMGGQDITAMPVHRREIGMVFQAHALFPHMTVGENVAFGLKMRGIPKDERRDRARSALASVRLQDFVERMPHELSGGQQQRVAIARAIVIKPKVLLLDEPFGALDRKLREALQVELRGVTRALAITSVFVTHDQEEALILSDRVAVMNAGKIEQIATPRAIFEEPSTRFVADFMGFANLRTATVLRSDDQALVLNSDGLQLEAMARADLKTGHSLELGIRRERILIDRLSSEGPKTANSVTGVIEGAIYHGNIWSYDVSTASGHFLVARPPEEREAGGGIEIGTAVALSWDKSAVRVF